MNSTLHTIEMSDGAVVVAQRCGNPVGPRLIVSHGNGFSIDAFTQLLAALGIWADVIAFDLRNHGRNPTHQLACHTQSRMRLDMRCVLDFVQTAFGEVPTHGLFHSLSGLHALHAEIECPGRFQHLVLLEPPVPPPLGHPMHAEQMSAQQALSDAALRRRDSFVSPQDMAARLEGRVQFEWLAPGALDDYCRGTLLETGERWVLRCPREFEAAGYERNLDDGFFARLPEVAIPVLIVAGAMSSFRRSSSSMLAEHAGFDLLTLQSISHLMPLEVPVLLSGLTRTYVTGR